MSEAATGGAAAPAPSAPQSPASGASAPASSAESRGTSSQQSLPGIGATHQGHTTGEASYQEKVEKAEAKQKAKLPWKTKAKIGEEEQELEIDVAPFLESYKHRVKVDGQESEVELAELAKRYERSMASIKRFEEASALRKQFEAERQAMAEREQKLEQAFADENKIIPIIRRTLGEEKWSRIIKEEQEAQARLAALSPEQREWLTTAEQRERELAQQAAKVRQQEQAIQAQREQYINRQAEERQRQFIAEWVPALEKAGLPAKVKGPNGEMVPNPRLIREVATVVRAAREAGTAITIEEAVRTVREEYEQLVGYEVERRKAAEMEALQQQPGRSQPAAHSASEERPASRPATSGRMTTDDFRRQLRQMDGKRR